ncbi:MAG TPA: hypothetical protein VKC56_07530 [Gallionellaceae bacterium]|nr:hypothetical protein [Gallionellaceae bacterium]
MKTKNYCLLTYLLLCAMATAYLALFYGYRQAPSIHLVETWRFWALIALAIWAEADSRDHRERIYRPYEFGFLVAMFSFFYLPYYLWRTRGAIGLAMLAGLLGLLLSGYVVEVLIYIR